MNYLLPFILLSATAYFGSSAVKQTFERVRQPNEAFAAISSKLEEIAGKLKYVTKTGPGTYCFWPKGVFDAVTYNGAFATYVQALPASQSFTITTMIYHNGAWTQLDTKSVKALEFVSEFNKVAGMPAGAKTAVLLSRATKPPALPPKGAKPY